MVRLQGADGLGADVMPIEALLARHHGPQDARVLVRQRQRHRVTLRDAGGVVENVSITDNDVGVSISGISDVFVRNCWVAGNMTGIALVGTSAKILQSAIVRNGTGLSLRGFSGEISENIIVDNEQNIFSDFPLKLDPNYIGQLPINHRLAHRLAARGAVGPASGIASWKPDLRGS